MNRDELVAFLASCISDKLTTEARAVELLKKFDAGELPNIELPLPREQVIQPLTQAMIDEALQ